jgi:hypothetical protein
MVEAYTERDLTFDSDRLPAISGLAKLMQTGPDDEYICGLWRKTLLIDLMWWVQDWKAPHKRHENYYAPTWAWSSISGPVHYRTEDEFHRFYEDLQLLNIDYTLSSSNSFGPVTQASITVRGVLIPVLVKVQEGTLSEYHNFTLHFPISHTTLEEPSVFIYTLNEYVYGANREFALGDQLFMLSVAKSRFDAEKYWIVMKKMKGSDGVFQLVGVAEWGSLGSPLDKIVLGLWCEGEERTTLQII